MIYQYIFDPSAADEYEEAFKWYEEKSVIVADNFILAVQNAITSICANPLRYRNTYKQLRELTIKKYPYNLIYSFDQDRELIIIVSLYHHKRNPKGKYQRSRSKKK